MQLAGADRNEVDADLIEGDRDRSAETEDHG